MFSVFRQKSVSDAPAVHDPLRVPLREAQALAASLLIEGETAPAPVELVDLSIAGTTIRIAAGEHVELAVDDLATLQIEDAGGNWSIRTAAQVYARDIEESGICRLGLDFVGEGDLFAQLASAAGKWFNRRRTPRARPELDRELAVQIAYKHYRPLGKIFDLSVSGLCISLDTMAAAPLRVGEPLQLIFELPGVKKPLEGRGVLKSHRRLRNRAYVGIEFDLDKTTILGKRHSEIVAYVERRLQEMIAFGREIGQES